MFIRPSSNELIQPPGGAGPDYFQAFPLIHRGVPALLCGMNEPVSASTPRQSALFATSGPLAGRLGAAFFASLPAGPGVYRFYGEDDRLLYIGQSSNLRARVGSYRFVNGASHSRRIVRMVARVFRAAWEECPSAAEAIALAACRT